jgi:hypothetical protein
VVLAGCGASSAAARPPVTPAASVPSTTPRVLAAAYVATLDTGSARFRPRDEGPVAGSTQTTRESGLMSFTSREQEETLTGAGGAEEIRGIGSALYINANPGAIARGGGVGRIVSSSGRVAGSSLPFASELSTVATRYLGTIDLASLTAARGMPGGLVSAVRSLFGTSGVAGLWLWIDARGLMVREEFSAELHIPASTGKPRYTVRFRDTIDYFDFGVPVHVVAPATSQAMPAPAPRPSPS